MVLHDSVYNGDIYDARLDRPHWDETNFRDTRSLWITPKILLLLLNIYFPDQYSFQDTPPIRVQLKLKLISVIIPFDGVHLFDTGQSMVG